MQYNTQQEKLIMPEYGRMVQEMVKHAMTLSDRAERQSCAQTIIDIMANMNPSMRSLPDYKHRLWDHLAFISHYQLDIDYPYPVTRLDEETMKPEPLHYPQKAIRNRHYGYVLEQLLAHLATMPEGEERDALLSYLANQMNQSLYDWNRDAMDAEKIAADIEHYTDGRVHLDLKKVKFSNVLQSAPRGGSSKKKKKK